MQTREDIISILYFTMHTRKTLKLKVKLRCVYLSCQKYSFDKNAILIG